MNNGPPERSFFIGRWQPLHEGHVRLIRKALDEGRDVLIGIMDTPVSPRNPHTIGQRQKMFWDAFGRELLGYEGRMTLLTMPWIDEVCYGRNCGWRSRRIRLNGAMELVSATAIRAEHPDQVDG